MFPVLSALIDSVSILVFRYQSSPFRIIKHTCDAVHDFLTVAVMSVYWQSWLQESRHRNNKRAWESWLYNDMLAEKFMSFFMKFHYYAQRNSQLEQWLKALHMIKQVSTIVSSIDTTSTTILPQEFLHTLAHGQHQLITFAVQITANYKEQSGQSLTQAFFNVASVIRSPCIPLPGHPIAVALSEATSSCFGHIPLNLFHHGILAGVHELFLTGFQFLTHTFKRQTRISRKQINDTCHNTTYYQRVAMAVGIFGWQTCGLGMLCIT